MDRKKLDLFTPVIISLQNEDEKEDTTQKGCKLEALKSGNKDIDTKSPLKAAFWPNKWRKLLCKCKKCKVIHLSDFVSTRD